MPLYVDGFVIPLPKKNVKAYVAMARQASKIWKEYGALEYRECIGDDLNIKMGLPFPKAARAKSGDTVVFAWITYKSKAQRDQVNKKIMKDPRIIGMMKDKKPPFDFNKMQYGGFKVAVEA